MPQQVGSITKTCTAAAILQQVELDRIQLDAPPHPIDNALSALNRQAMCGNATTVAR